MNIFDLPDHEHGKLIKKNFPNAKPFSRGKAYVWWRNKSNKPPAVFDTGIMTNQELLLAAVRIGGFLIGTKYEVNGQLPVILGSLSACKRERLQGYYSKHPVLLRTGPELSPFAGTSKRAEELYGSVPDMLKQAGATLELTSQKIDGIKRPTNVNQGGKYFIMSDGIAYFVTEAEEKEIKSLLGIQRIVHGDYAIMIQKLRGENMLEVIDYGCVVIKNEKSTGSLKITISDNFKHWKNNAEFDVYGYLSEN